MRHLSNERMISCDAIKMVINGSTGPTNHSIYHFQWYSTVDDLMILLRACFRQAGRPGWGIDCWLLFLSPFPL
jgi:hypothetical protein